MDENPTNGLLPETPEQIRGRSIFVIETTVEGIRVQTAFLTDDGQILQMPAVFPDQQYALTQIEHLRIAVVKHFTEAAQIGAKIIAQTAQVGPGSDDIIH